MNLVDYLVAQSGGWAGFDGWFGWERREPQADMNKSDSGVLRLGGGGGGRGGSIVS